MADGVGDQAKLLSQFAQIACALIDLLSKRMPGKPAVTSRSKCPYWRQSARNSKFCDRIVLTASVYQIFFRKIGSPDNEVFAIII